MKPYQTAWDVAEFRNKYPNKPVNINAITEYFRAGMERELKKIQGSGIKDLDQMKEVLAWQYELNRWLMCWHIWTNPRHHSDPDQARQKEDEKPTD